MGDPTSLERLTPWLRLRVARLRSTTTSRSFPVCVEVVSLGEQRARGADGDPGAILHAAVEHAPPALDRGLRVDLLCRLMSAAPRSCTVVVTRPDLHDACTDDDLAWSGAALAAAGVSSVDLAAVVMLSRWGWLDLLSGRRRDWKRLRIRSA